MTGAQWAQVFEAGWRAIPSKSEPAANALALALAAMAAKAAELDPPPTANEQERP